MLLLRYGLRILQYPDNPTSKLFHRNTTHPRKNPSLPTTSGYRFKQSIQKYKIGIHQLLVKSLPTIPPWINPRPSITILSESFTKTQTLHEVYHQQHKALKRLHQTHTQYYTDAAKDHQDAGIAFIQENTGLGNQKPQGKFKTPSISSICELELQAIHQALLHGKQNKSIAVYTDSRSALHCLDNLYSQSATVHTIRDLTRTENLRVNYCWVPSHSGINGNEKADQLAKEAMTSGQWLETPITARDLYKTIHEEIRADWQRNWNHETDNHLRKIKPYISSWTTSFRQDRHEETILCRLRTGHTRLTHTYLFRHERQPDRCRHCNDILTTKHILCDCPVLQTTRDRYLQTNDITQVLKDDESNIKNLFNYLKHGNLLAEI